MGCICWIASQDLNSDGAITRLRLISMSRKLCSMSECLNLMYVSRPKLGPKNRESVTPGRLSSLDPSSAEDQSDSALLTM